MVESDISPLWRNALLRPVQAVSTCDADCCNRDCEAVKLMGYIVRLSFDDAALCMIADAVEARKRTGSRKAA